MKKLISIVIPAYNEEDVVHELCKRIRKTIDSSSRYSFELIVVENGSTDHTLNVLQREREKDKRIKILQLAKNVGCDGGIMAGLSFASGDAAIVMMADLQEPPELMIKFLDKWEMGYDIVYGVVKKRKNLPLFKIVGAYIFYRLMRILTHGTLPENVSDFRLLDKKVYTILNHIPEHNKFFRGIAGSLGFKQIGIHFQRPERFAGYSKADLITSIKVACNGILSFSYMPLRLAWVFSVIFFIASLIGILFFKLQISIMLIIACCICIMLGIQGEYLMRVLDESRNRPNFVVEKIYGLSKN